MTRQSGILMPVSALPSPYGIGSVGRAAHRFCDFLQAAGQSVWQVLPLGPTGFGDSPYQTFSVFAGNPYLIDLEDLAAQGLLTAAELDAAKAGGAAIDYGALYRSRPELLRLAFSRAGDDDACLEFENAQAAWLPDYALFMALKRHFSMAPWQDWPEPYRLRQPEALESARQALAEDIRYEIWVQFQFDRQWKALTRHAHDCGVRLMGDVPIYPALDSADVWAAPQWFQLDEQRRPVWVAGVPPDDFSETGQLWGNPLYDWDALKADGYGWWIRRIGRAGEMFDLLRLDHFRGFAEYWAVPAGAETAQDGHWEPGPGAGFVGVLKTWFHGLRFVAEDLGAPSDGLTALLAFSGFPNMRVLQFAFDSPNNPHLPHNAGENCVYYTGTHDNHSLRGWLAAAPRRSLRAARQYFCLTRSGAYFGLLAGAMRSPARLCILQLQDVLRLDCRTNTPGQAQGNWVWRLPPGLLTRDLARALRALTARYGRC